MNILVVTHYFSDHGGGVEVIASELARRLVSRGVRVTWAASGPSSLRCEDGLSILPMPCLNVSERRLGIPYPLWSPASMPALFNAVRRCDVLHLHDCLYMGNVLAYIYARLLRKPIVVTQHIGTVPYSHLVARYLLRCANATLARWVLAGSHRTVFYSEKVRRYFSDRRQFRVDPAHIANGVDTAAFAPVTADEQSVLRRRLGWPSHQPVLLFVGRFVEKKGLHVIRALADRFRDCTWVLVGAGPISPADWNFPHVRTIGWLDHNVMPSLYQAADLLVLPSVGEGFPLVVQEAMACGTPVLISDDTAAGCPGVEAVAFVSEPRFDRMGPVLDDILQHPSVLGKRRAAVAEYAKREWNWDECVSAYVEVFEQIKGNMVSSSIGRSRLAV